MSIEAPHPEAHRGDRAEWTQRPERGSALLLRLTVFLSLRLGRTVTRSIVYVTAGYFFLFSPTTRRHSRNYLRRALARSPGALDQFRLVLAFASIIHDRIFLLHGRYDLFQISTEGEELLTDRIAKRQGAVLIGAHMGSFDILQALGQQQSGLEVAIAIYQENVRQVTTVLTAINPAVTPDIIALGQVDAMLRVRDRLDAGAMVGMLGDRSLGKERGQAVSFFGSPAQLPLGPLRTAALLRQPVIFMLGLYTGGNRYNVVFEPLADFSATSREQRAEDIQRALDRYAQLLEKYCRLYPYNWFNFYDFWQRP